VTDEGAVAAIDCGTNSTRLLVVDGAGSAMAREMRITRLGEGVDTSRHLRDDAIERTIAVLRGFRLIMDGAQVARARMVATSAVRDASDGQRFLSSAAEIVGVEAELLSGEEEGRLSYEGATADLPREHGMVAVIDIGGGSTELVVKPDHEIRSISMDIGCVRVTERFLVGDPPLPEEISRARDAIRMEFDRAVDVIPELRALGPDTQLVGLAGTVSTLASLELDLERYDRARIHHALLTRDAVEHWCEVLGRESVAERARRVALPQGRQDVIVGGALVLSEAMRTFDLATCLVSEADLLDGLVMSLRA
jgi:exopolyphosphatase / guanosine-5'-triphosphate,3'-diphosphate pyrophosphatase